MGRIRLPCKRPLGTKRGTLEGTQQAEPNMQTTISEAARRLGVADKTVRRRVHNGELLGTQVSTPQGFTWMVEIPDEVPNQDAGAGERSEDHSDLRELVETLKEELARKNTQIEQLHVLLQQQAMALPAPKDQRNWWRFW